MIDKGILDKIKFLLTYQNENSNKILKGFLNNI